MHNLIFIFIRLKLKYYVNFKYGLPYEHKCSYVSLIEKLSAIKKGFQIQKCPTSEECVCSCSQYWIVA